MLFATTAGSMIKDMIPLQM